MCDDVTTAEPLLPCLPAWDEMIPRHAGEASDVGRILAGLRGMQAVDG